MRTDTPQTIYLKNYSKYPFSIESLDANFDIHDGYTIVTAISKVKSIDGARDMHLFGEALDLQNLKVNGADYSDFTKDDSSLTLKNLPDVFTLEIVTKITPETNTRLEGLYMSGGNYCTQCEAEGFRRITYYPDRPDVMTVFTVRVEADKKFPVLLSNGNKTSEGDLGNGRHFTVWHDPHLKPCYLFALVAGDLTQIHDTFTTKSGRKVDLYIYVRHGDEGQCDHAMESLKRSMIWDEKVYGLEYDLDIFNIVAVSDFNMGAMENKSLNIFNTALVLAHQETATDSDFLRVEGVIAHEYFHNWSGNRVTCRDWFQLSLKEGLTVFRDQEFTADHHSRVVQRIDDVSHLRKFQFPEDSSPLAHPIRPDNYIEINNFYTMTVYEKGAEVIRMMRTILGEHNYRKGTDLYFQRHDGQAVTCDDFVQAMQDASGIDLTQFRLWYSQAGTPEVTFKGEYDEAAQKYKITLTQNTPDTAGQSGKKPMVIPVSVGLMSHNAHDLIGTRTLMLTKAEQVFEIENIHAAPIPSVLRNFSAPVILKAEHEDKELEFLMLHDADGFNRWEAAQRYMLTTIGYMMHENAPAPPCAINAFGGLLDKAIDPHADKAFMARILTLPEIGYIGQHYTPCDPPAIAGAKERLLRAIYESHSEKIQDLYDLNRTPDAFTVTPEAMGRRSLQNAALRLLSYGDEDEIAPRAMAQYEQANNMTDRVAALGVLAEIVSGETEAAFADFYTRYKDYQLVIDKWFSLQASAQRPDIIKHLAQLRQHPDFNIKNPNRARSLFSAFAMNNPVCFHAADGSGYAFLRDAVIELNAINPQIAARLLTPLREWKRYTPDRQEKMKAALAAILETKDIAPDVFEIASKSLKG